MTICEVVETKYALKDGQKDDKGNPLPLGSVQIRLGSHQSNLGQVRNVYARPAIFKKRIPLIGETVIVFSGPTNDWSTSSNKGVGFYYLAPVNATDDLVLHAFHKLWRRSTSGASGAGFGERKSDKKEPGYSFPKSPRPVSPLQPFEGDDIYEGRFGSSIRFSSTVSGDTSVYSKTPTWKGGSNGDPLIIMSVSTKSGAGNKYRVEDIGADDSSFYLTSKQSLSSLKAGFDKNQDVKQLGNWSGGSQAILNADRIVMNAKKNMLFLVGKEKVVVTGKKVLLQSDKFKVDLDELMEFLKKWLDADADLAQGSAQYSTASGPTATASNSSKYISLKSSDYTKFKQA